MSTAAAKQFGALSAALEPRLLRFFQRYPPVQSETSLQPYQGPNPFAAQRSPITGLWHNPKYSLRQQSDLCKLAEESGLDSLLPHSLKSQQFRAERRSEGLKVKGTGVGQKVKGHWWERTLYTRLESRRQAMLDMPNLIYKWKKLGRGRGWKKWPK